MQGVYGFMTPFLGSQALAMRKAAEAVEGVSARVASPTPSEKVRTQAIWTQIVARLGRLGSGTHASADVPELGSPIKGARSKAEVAEMPGSRESLLTGNPFRPKTR